jgi:hypothetical protein
LPITSVPPDSDHPRRPRRPISSATGASRTPGGSPRPIPAGRLPTSEYCSLQGNGEVLCLSIPLSCGVYQAQPPTRQPQHSLHAGHRDDRRSPRVRVACRLFTVTACSLNLNIQLAERNRRHNTTRQQAPQTGGRGGTRRYSRTMGQPPEHASAELWLVACPGRSSLQVRAIRALGTSVAAARTVRPRAWTPAGSESRATRAPRPSRVLQAACPGPRPLDSEPPFPRASARLGGAKFEDGSPTSRAGGRTPHPAWKVRVPRPI